jgi:hypothetical protein
MFAVQRVEENEFPLITASIQSTWNPQEISTSPHPNVGIHDSDHSTPQTSPPFFDELAIGDDI